MTEFKYLDTLCEHSSIDEVRERAVKCGQMVGTFESHEGKSVGIEVKKGLRSHCILPTLSYASDMDM